MRCHYSKAKHGVINHKVSGPVSIVCFSGWVIKEDNRGECFHYLRVLSYFWILFSHFQFDIVIWMTYIKY